MTLRLTPREHDIVRLIRKGYTRRKIAQSLRCSVNTVHTHMQRISRRLPGDPNVAVKTRLLQLPDDAIRVVNGK